MDGNTHALVGGIVGGLVSYTVGNGVISLDTGVLVAAGTVAGLLPDLDTNGKLSNKITASGNSFKGIFRILSILVIIYSLVLLGGTDKLLGLLFGIVSFVVTGKVTQRKMQLATGLVIILVGVVLSKLWVILLGLYVMVASIVGHRTHTHSLLGLGYFSYVVILAGKDFHMINGIELALILGYVSHIVLDFKIFNKRGVQLLRPFSKLEI